MMMAAGRAGRSADGGDGGDGGAYGGDGGGGGCMEHAARIEEETHFRLGCRQEDAEERA